MEFFSQRSSPNVGLCLFLPQTQIHQDLIPILMDVVSIYRNSILASIWHVALITDLTCSQFVSRMLLSLKKKRTKPWFLVMCTSLSPRLLICAKLVADCTLLKFSLWHSMNVEVFLLCMGAANSGAYCVKQDKKGLVVRVQQTLRNSNLWRCLPFCFDRPNAISRVGPTEGPEADLQFLRGASS